MGTLRATALLAMFGCAVDVVEPGDPVEDPATAADAAARYQQAMCLDDFRAANMTAAWQTTTMYPHEAAYCSSCHGGGRDGFFAPRLDVYEPIERERQFFVGLKGAVSNLTAYVAPGIDAAGAYTMAVNRAVFEAVAAGAFGHERFTLDEQPGPEALVRFHDLTMKRLASGAPCGSPH